MKPKGKIDRLLTREEFKEAVFERDNGKCVCCEKKAVDAHHIMERRLFPDGGYYLDNGVSLCEEDHLKAEQTVISCEELRERAGIVNPLLPPHLETDQKWDKWGNPVLPTGMRLKGELFQEESVQKILAEGGVLDRFLQYVKYPRTYHLPWSPTVSKDDKTMPDTSVFEGRRVVVTAKMDGENTTMYSDYLHARSLDGRHHPSRNWVKALHGRIAHEIPQGWRVCGENMYAQHSLVYENLDDYFLVFSIWDENNVCLSWDDTKMWCELLGLPLVPVLYDGEWNEEVIKNLYKEELNGDPLEGYVVRSAEAFQYKDFRKNVAKYVSTMFKSHFNENTEHWQSKAVVPNKVARNDTDKKGLRL